MKQFARLMSVAVFGLALAATGAMQSHAGSDDLAGVKLLKELRTGGYLLYFRHSITDHGQSGKHAVTYSKACLERGECGSCNDQRILTQEGRQQARKIGTDIKDLKIPFGRILASPLCRTMDTASLIFGRAEASVGVRDGGLGPTSHPRLRKILSTPVPAGSNQAVSGHSGQFQTVAGPNSHLDEGEAAVIKGFGDGKFKILARIRAQDWDSLKKIMSQ